MRYRDLILLLILGCSLELAPDKLRDSVDSLLDVLRTIFLKCITIICEVEYCFTEFMDFWALNFFRGFQLWAEIYFSFCDSTVEFLCSEFMFVCYDNVAYIFHNVSSYVDGHVYIWLLQNIFRVRFQHTSHSVIAHIGFTRVVYVLGQRTSTLLLCFLVARAIIPMHTGVLTSAGKDFRYMIIFTIVIDIRGPGVPDATQFCQLGMQMYNIHCIFSFQCVRIVPFCWSLPMCILAGAKFALERNV